MDAQALTAAFKNLEVNVPPIERAISALSGSLMLYNSLSKKPKNLPRALFSAYMIFRGATGHCPVYKIAGKKLEPAKVSNVNIRVTLTIEKPVSYVYQFWRKLDNLPLFMKHLESVEIIDDKTSEWKAPIPGNLGSLKWKAAIVKDIENREISWHSLSDSMIHNAGKIDFHENGSFGTKMDVVVSYRAPLGKAGETVAKILNPIFADMVEQDIARFKEYIENK
ncbi:MAG TPA: SRPBCC family protein [Flavobacterium sp.]|nr:SRPBCC family protein [Flavobacterium sp.]